MAGAADARTAPDGYQYGVRFGDGSVSAKWNGRTQRARAEADAARIVADQMARVGRHDPIVPVRRRRGGPWETY